MRVFFAVVCTLQRLLMRVSLTEEVAVSVKTEKEGQGFQHVLHTHCKGAAKDFVYQLLPLTNLEAASSGCG